MLIRACVLEKLKMMLFYVMCSNVDQSTKITGLHTVNSEIFARVLFSRSFAKWQIHSVVY